MAYRQLIATVPLVEKSQDISNSKHSRELPFTFCMQYLHVVLKKKYYLSLTL